MRLLCIAAESKRKGYVLVNGREPSIDDLSRITGAGHDDVKMWLSELDRNGVYSKTRQGIIYCRRMVKLTKKRAASAKGGKIGGRTTHDKQTGIFATQTPTQEGTQGGTQPPRRAPLPSPIPITQKKEEILESSFHPGNGNGKHQDGTTTIADPHDRLARFQAKIASHLGPRGWEIVASAVERTDPQHDANLAICKAAAREMQKGWPNLWR